MSGPNVIRGGRIIGSIRSKAPTLVLNTIRRVDDISCAQQQN